MPISDSYSETIKGNFNESKRFIMGFVRKGIPWVDADENKKEWIRFTQMRRAFDILIGNASPNNGFKPVGTGANNDFTLKGGDGSLDGAGRMYVAGMGCFLLSDIAYKNAGASDDQLSIFPSISFITTSVIANDTINDEGANFIPGELVGRTVTPDVKQPALTATVIQNGANTIVVNTDLVVLGVNLSTLPRYRVELSPPNAGVRTDDIYINAWVDEITDTKDPSIRHNLGTLIAGQFYGGLRQTIYVRQGGGAVALKYVDVNGLEHFLTKIGTISRTAGQNALNPIDVVDLRATSGSLTSFLPKAGGTMTGNIQLNGADIVMLGAEKVDGRDVSVDGAKLDGITFTGPGVAALLPLISWPVQGTDLVAVATQAVNVSTYLKNRVPGGTVSQKGVITAPPLNRVVTQGSSTEDDIIDATGAKVFGRLTEATQVLSGTIAFTFGSTTIAGTGTSWLTQLQVGDIIHGADGNWYTIATVGPAEGAATLVETYLGPNASGVGGVNRQRWTLSLFSNVNGTETAFTPSGPIGISWFWHEVFDSATRPVINPLFSIPSDQVAGEVPIATTSLPGRVQLAPDGGVTAGQAVQADDSRLGRVKIQNAGVQTGVALGAGATSGLEGIVNVIAGNSGISIAVYEDAGTGKVTIVFTNTSPGGGGPPAYGGTPQPDVAGGAAGNPANYAAGTHQHTPSTFYTIQRTFLHQSQTTAVTVNTGFTPRMMLALAHQGNIVSVGAALSQAQQAAVSVSGSGANENTGQVITSLTAGTWAVSQFNATSVVINPSGVGVAWDMDFFVFGDNLP